MNTLRAFVRFSGIVALLTAFLPFSSDAQGIESYALAHPFGLGGASSIRLYGMGGMIAAVPDYGNANPAWASTKTVAHAGSRYKVTDFDSGLTLKSFQVDANYPLSPGKRGIQLTYHDLGSSSGSLMIPGVGAVPMGISAEELALHYSQRLTEDLYGGIGLAPVGRIKFTVGGPGGPPVMDVRAETDKGARLGLAYRLRENVWAGFVGERFDEDVKASGLALGGELRTSFTSSQYALGVSGYVHERVLAAVEWQTAASKGNNTRNSVHGWHLGLEALVQDEWKVRAGCHDGRFSTGVGFERGRWRADYAYLNNWNAEAVRPIMGSSDTHMLGVFFAW